MGAAKMDRDVVDPEFAAIGFLHSKQRPAEGFATGTLDAGDAQHLAIVEIEGHLLILPASAEPPHAQGYGACCNSVRSQLCGSRSAKQRPLVMTSDLRREGPRPADACVGCRSGAMQRHRLAAQYYPSPFGRKETGEKS